MTFGRLLTCVVILWPALAGAIEIQELQAGVWAATQPEDNRFNDSNSLIVEAEDFVVIIDAQENSADIDSIIGFVRDSIRKPVRYLINTHWHGDHTQGNALYRRAYGDALVIVGHKTQADDIPQRAATSHAERVQQYEQLLPAARAQLETGIKLDGSAFTDEELEAQTTRVERAEAWIAANRYVTFTGPTRTIDSMWSMDAGTASFTVYPQRGHTRGDLLIHFPKLRVLAAGDLVDVMPYSGHGYPGEWLAALAFIETLDFATLVPGHGPVLRDRELLSRLASYFDSLTQQVARLVDAGNSLAQVKQTVDLSASRRLLAGDDPVSQRFFDAVQEEAVQRAFEEISNNE